MSEYIVSVPFEHDEVFVANMGAERTHLYGYELREEIVRCRDCKYLIAHGAGCAHWDYCDIESIDGFCAWGERRGDAE